MSGPRAGRREWLALAALAPPCLLTVMDLAVLVLAVPELTADLEPSPVELLWITDIYGFLIAGALITMGTLGDRIGRRRLLLIGGAAFGLTSLLAAYSTSPEMLIAARGLQGVAGATLVPCTMALLFAMFQDERQRGVALGVIMGCFAAGAALGPVLGGVLLSSFWWGSVFLVNVPVMVLLLVVGPRLLPEYRAPDAGRLDLASAALSVVAVLGVIYGIKRAAQDGIDGLALTAMAAGVLVGIVFVRRQARLSDPLIDLRMFRAPRFSVGLGIATLAAFVMYGLYLLATEYMQLVLGLSPLEAGLWLLPSAVAVAAGSNLAPQLVRWFSPAAVIAGGLAMMVAGFAALTTVEPGSPLALLIAASVVIHLGVGPVSTLLIGMIVGAAPPERAGAASALSHTGNEFGGALGLGLLGSLVTAIYRHDTGTTGAFADVDGLPAGALQTAERAIAHGFEVAAFVSAGLVAGALVLALAVLRTPARRDAESPATAPA